MDCYAEFQTHADARDTANRINRIYESGRPPRLGNRHVDVDLTNQNELLKDLFPRAKCIVWRGGMPYPQENSDPYCSGFTGFFTAEEIILAIRHAEIPHRVSYKHLPWLLIQGKWLNTTNPFSLPSATNARNALTSPL